MRSLKDEKPEMKAQTTRRDFLNGLALSMGAMGSCFLPTFSHATAASLPSIKFPSEPRQRISVSSYPFREFIAGDRHKSGNPTIELKDFAAHVVERFNVNKIEPWTHHFPSTDPKYLEEFRQTVEKAGAAIANLAVDGTDSAYAADRAERARAIAYSKKWIDVAVVIASPSIRTNIARAKDSKPDAERLSESLRRVAEYASARNVVVHLENDDSMSEDPFFLVQAIKKVKSPWLRTLPDFGNTLSERDENYAYRAIDAMFAYSYGICHVKDSIGNEQGTVKHVDLARTFEILRRHSYKGYCSIEYDESGDPYKPTAMLVDTIVKYLS